MDRSEFKSAIIGEIGCKMDDMLESAMTELHKHAGAVDAMLHLSTKVADLSAHVDKDLEAGLFNDIVEPLLVAQVVKKYITRAVGVVESVCKQESNATLVSEGRMQALRLIVTNLKKMQDVEKAKQIQREAVAAAVAAGVPVEGKHPGPSIKERRLAEAATEVQSATEVSPVVADVLVGSKPEAEPVGPRRPRRRRAVRTDASDS